MGRELIHIGKAVHGIGRLMINGNLFLGMEEG